jgi:hypothetical protein
LHKKWCATLKGNRAMLIAERACGGCGETYAPAGGSGGLSRYCSPRCRNPVGVSCLGCGTRFFPRQKKKYCSRACSQRKMKRYQLKCAWCCAEFKSWVANAACCSRKCQNRKREADAPQREAQCRVCAATFTYQHLGGTPARYCSQRCLETRRRKARSQYINAAKRLRADRITANGIENIDPTVVFERDNWMCRLCGISVKRNCHHHDPLAPTVDHIHPVSMGGPHTMANVQCAHRVCNERKNNKVVA